MATKIRLMRLGKIRAPYYRIVVADSRTKRDGRVIETIGKYHPKQDPSLIEVDSDRARYWLSVGAQPTEPVAAILKITGDWQAHRGLPAPEAGVKVAAPRPDRKAIFEAAAKETLETADAPAKKTTAKKTTAKKASKKATEPATDAASDSDAPAAAQADAAPEPAADAGTPTEAPDAAAQEAAPSEASSSGSTGSTGSTESAEPQSESGKAGESGKTGESGEPAAPSE